MTTKDTTTAQDRKFLAEARKFEAEAKRLEIDAAKAQLERRSFEIVVAREEKADLEKSIKNDENRVYHFFGEVDAMSAYNLMRAMERFGRLGPGKPAEILFTSPGGSILAGLAAIDHIATIRRQYKMHVTTKALGMAASMAGILLQSGDTRVMGRESWLLIHQASFMAGGSYGEVMDTIDWVGKIQDRIVDLFVSRTKGKIDKAAFVKNWQRKDWWLSAKDALRYGFIDEVR